MPSDSTTTDTQGALQTGATGSTWPRCARKCRTIFRNFSGDSATNPLHPFSSTIDSISDSSTRISSLSRPTDICCPIVHPEGRLNAVDVRSAARNEIPFKPRPRAAAIVARSCVWLRRCIVQRALIGKSGRRVRIALTPAVRLSNARGTRRMRLCTSRGPSSESLSD